MGEACLHSSNTDQTAFLPAQHSPVAECSDAPWYALKVRTGGEATVVSTLKSRGFAPYCPTQKERRRYSDRMKVVEVPVFPGYIFCCFDARHKLPVISCPGVEYIVGFGSGPIPVPEAELTNIRRMIDAGAFAVPGLARGQRVRITHGPLQGIEGILVRDNTGDQLVVSIDLLGRGACLRIDEYEVCPV